jgi:3-isopropylmalate/(R)-2-methylmalate dehydratase small subunit
VVGGSNFGLGSSREHAPRIIKLAGISAVLAKSFARIFFRNAINVGLPVLVCDTDRIQAGDVLEIDLTGGVVVNKTQGIQLEFAPLPPSMVKILADGGLVKHFKKHGRIAVDDA